jgi:surface polysaccharide O-acyltransferase-like enzyme
MRLQRVDAFRVFAIFVVICAHTQIFGGFPRDSAFGQLIDSAFIIFPRWTMPFFFMLAGYFLGGKIVKEPAAAVSIASKYTGRLVLVFLFWSVIYTIEQPYHTLQLLKEHPIHFFLQGPRIHLWFLVSLILTVWLFVVWPFKKLPYSFLLLGLVLFILGLLGGPYQFTDFGFHLPFSNKCGVFLSTLFFAIGVHYSQNIPRVSTLTAMSFAFAGMIIFCVEAYNLKNFELPTRHDYLIGSIPWSLGVFFIAFKKSDTYVEKLTGSYGKYVLGVYVIHMLFVDLWQPLINVINVEIWTFFYPLVVFVSAIMATILLAKTPLRRFVI